MAEDSRLAGGCSDRGDSGCMIRELARKEGREISNPGLRMQNFYRQNNMGWIGPVP